MTNYHLQKHRYPPSGKSFWCIPFQVSAKMKDKQGDEDIYTMIVNTKAFQFSIYTKKKQNRLLTGK